MAGAAYSCAKELVGPGTAKMEINPGLSWMVRSLQIDAFVSPTDGGFVITATNARAAFALAKNRYFLFDNY